MWRTKQDVNARNKHDVLAKLVMPKSVYFFLSFSFLRKGYYVKSDDFSVNSIRVDCGL